MCQSPLAEGLLKQILQQRNLKAEVDSAGFEVYHINESPDKRAVKKGLEHGIDITNKKVRLFSSEDFNKFDKIYVMDTLAYRNAIDFARNKEDKKKVDFLMNLISEGKNESVPDPYYGKLEAGEESFNILQKACNKIADEIQKQD
jgi:protein-tyrosine phosphatase